MMSKETKTHYRKVFKSDHLGVADLEDFTEAGSNLVFTIAHVRQEINAKVAGKKINANIAYFSDSIKPLVLNATNSKALKTITGSSFIEDWANVPVQLYIDPQVKMKGDIVGGVRVSPNKVKLKQEITMNNRAMWGNAKKAYARDGNFNAVLQRAIISPENQQAMIQEINGNV